LQSKRGGLAALTFVLAMSSVSLASAQAPSTTSPRGAIDAPGAMAIDLGPALGAPRGDGRWRGGILLDEGFRNMIRLSAVEDQEIARQISDFTMGATVLNAMAIDAALIPALQGDGELVWRAQVSHALAQGVTIGAGEIVKRMVGRARPYERECAEDPTRHGCDGGNDVFASFYSLHSGVAFTSAGFSCSMHLARNLYDDIAADATACGISLGLATTTAILRVVADRHYLSDIMVGAAMGFLVGFVMPLALVPERSSRVQGLPDQTQAQAIASPIEPGIIGLSAGGSF
jgi:membrane-associated phospholipid phosphatase